MSFPQLIDSFGRTHDYLRISLTDACNLRCVYCMPNEKLILTPSQKLMQVDEIERIAKIFIELGIKKIRLTGGEPLVRKDAKEIIQRLSQLPVELALSTNALLADKFIDVLKEAKIKAINVSLDTLNPEEFLAITQRNDFEKIMNNISLLLSSGFKLKINMVVMKGINEKNIFDFIDYTKEHDVDVRFIEFMPFSGNKWVPEKVVGYKEMLDAIATKYDFIKLEDAVSDTAKKYKIKKHTGSFAFITTITEPFCGNCNRLRITADGKMKNCLFSKDETNLLTALRNGNDIIPLILANVKNKKQERGGQFMFDDSTTQNLLLNVDSIENRSMIQIGG
jgi:cyclic pyranopterin phosphate synthase